MKKNILVTELEQANLVLRRIEPQAFAAKKKKALIANGITCAFSLFLTIYCIVYIILFKDEHMDAFSMDIVLHVWLLAFVAAVFVAFLAKLIIFLQSLKAAKKDLQTPFYIKNPMSTRGFLFYNDKAYDVDSTACPTCKGKMHVKGMKDDTLLFVCSQSDTHCFGIEIAKIAQICDSLSE